MQEIINGILYDTEADDVEEIASHSYSSPGDFNFWEETLYKTEKGNYFIAGSGGALSRYGRSTGNGNSEPGFGIRPLTEDKAFNACCEMQAPAEVVEKYFPGRLESA